MYKRQLDGLEAVCFGERAAAPAPACSAPLCIAVVLTLLPTQWAAQRPLPDPLAAARCAVFDATALLPARGERAAAAAAPRCACDVAAADTARAARAQLRDAHFTVWGDSTARNFNGFLGGMLRELATAARRQDGGDARADVDAW